MAVDMLRSCYSTDARFFADRPDIVLPINWYFCPDGAQVLPGPHRFGSLNYLSDKNTPSPIGEVPGAARPYSKGQTPAGITGQSACGSTDDFHDGVIYSETANYPVSGGVKQCCNTCFRGAYGRLRWPLVMYLSTVGRAGGPNVELKNFPLVIERLSPTDCAYAGDDLTFFDTTTGSFEVWEIIFRPGDTLTPASLEVYLIQRFRAFDLLPAGPQPEAGFTFNPLLGKFAQSGQLYEYDPTSYTVEFTVSEVPIP